MKINHGFTKKKLMFCYINHSLHMVFVVQLWLYKW